MEFLGNVFANFIFFKFLSHEALVTEFQLPVTVKRSFLSSYKWQKCFERYRQLRLFPKQIPCRQNWGAKRGAKQKSGGEWAPLRIATASCSIWVQHSIGSSLVPSGKCNLFWNINVPQLIQTCLTHKTQKVLRSDTKMTCLRN